VRPEWSEAKIGQGATESDDKTKAQAMTWGGLRGQVILELHPNDDPEEPRHVSHRPTVRTGRAWDLPRVLDRREPDQAPTT
jgi:hypothetical protein